MPLTPQQITTLAALANGIIPSDQMDGGAGAVNAGSRLAEKIHLGINAALYLQGLESAETAAMEMYARAIDRLSAQEVHEVLGALRERVPAFFKQLRMDVSAMYLSDPAVWQRIGFPGPSIASGGYPDFDQPQTEKVTKLKEGS